MSRIHVSKDEIMRYSEGQLRTKVDPIYQTKKEKQKARMREFRKEASRRASMANKRLDRLGDSDYKDSPAYQKWVKRGLWDSQYEVKPTTNCKQNFHEWISFWKVQHPPLQELKEY